MNVVLGLAVAFGLGFWAGQLVQRHRDLYELKREMRRWRVQRAQRALRDRERR